MVAGSRSFQRSSGGRTSHSPDGSVNPRGQVSGDGGAATTAVKAAGLKDVTPHDLRASHATWVADRHGVMAAAKRLGHSNASVTTRHYARALDGRNAEVARTLEADRAGVDPRVRSGHEGKPDGSDRRLDAR